jgi:hypothetical protein
LLEIDEIPTRVNGGNPCFLKKGAKKAKARNRFENKGYGFFFNNGIKINYKLSVSKPVKNGKKILKTCTLYGLRRRVPS